MSVASFVQLLRWLGPWTDPRSSPPGVERSAVAIAPSTEGDRPLDAWFYRPTARRERGAYLVAPGLHFNGPADPRLDRFARVLASAGFATMVPFLPDFQRLRVEPAVVDDFARTFDALVTRIPDGRRPAIFGISFGSLPALGLAARPGYAERIARVIVFGGYADFRATIRHAIGGEGRPPDPLSLPAVFMNLVEGIPGAPDDTARLREAWLSFARQTWGRPEMKRDGRHVEVAKRLAADLPEPERDLFLLGTRSIGPAAGHGGSAARARAACEAALDRLATRAASLDLSGRLGGVRAPVHLFHGIDDDVIPATQAEAIRALLPSEAAVEVRYTGLFGHADRADGALLGRGIALAKELVTMLRMLKALSG